MTIFQTVAMLVYQRIVIVILAFFSGYISDPLCLMSSGGKTRNPRILRIIALHREFWRQMNLCATKGDSIYYSYPETSATVCVIL